MNTKAMLWIFAIVAAVTLATTAVAATIIIANSTFAEGGPKGEKNFGQCKQDKNPCVYKVIMPTMEFFLTMSKR